nr:unnamed protein product [Digitaria exilis]
MMKHRVVGGPLKDLGDAIKRAHEVVTACQGRNILCLFCKAGKLAKKLSQGVLRDGLKVAIKEFQDPPQFLVGRLSAKLRIASKLQSKYIEASGYNKYIIRVQGYGHECKWGHDSLETHIFLVEDYCPNGNMDTIIFGPYRLHWSSRFRIILRAWNVRNNQQMDVTFEASLFEESELPELTRCLEIGLLCTQFEQAERPTMAEILDMLNGKKGLTIPKQPEYTKKKGL